MPEASRHFGVQKVPDRGKDSKATSSLPFFGKTTLIHYCGRRAAKMKEDKGQMEIKIFKNYEW